MPQGSAMPAELLRLLSFNIQVGLQTQRYSHYLTRAWRHALPAMGPHTGLDAAAQIMRGYDFVAIQEADAGSLRTRFLNQMDYLAEQGGFAHHGYTVTRDLRPVARHTLGFLSRWPARIIDDHALPGLLPGRRALHVELQIGKNAVSIFVVHLSLGAATQQLQLDRIASLVPADRPSLIMGDFNCDPQVLREHPALLKAGFWLPESGPLSFPSWAPRRSIDHILLSQHLQMHELKTLPAGHSDHLPLSAEIMLRPPPQT